jgi:hypothetical protein
MGLLGALLVIAGIGLMYWNMNRWKEKAQVLEVQLISMTAARDLLLDINEAKTVLDSEQQKRREEVEKNLNEGNRDFFTGGMK